MQITEKITAIWKKLKVHVDGEPGPETWGAIYAALIKPSIKRLPPELAIS